MATIPAILSKPGDWFGNNGLNNTYDIHLAAAPAEKTFIRHGLEKIVERIGARNYLPRAMVLAEPEEYVLARTMGSRSVFFPDTRITIELSELGYEEGISQEFVLRQKGGGLALDGVLTSGKLLGGIGKAILRSMIQYHDEKDDRGFGAFVESEQQNNALVSGILGMLDRYERPEGGNTLELSLFDLKTRPFVRSAPVVYVTKHGKDTDTLVTDLTKSVKRKAWIELLLTRWRDTFLEGLIGYFNRNPFYGEISKEPYSSEYQLVPSVVRVEDFFKGDIQKVASLIQMICPSGDMREQARSNYCRDIARYLGNATTSVRHKKNGNYRWDFTGDIELIYREKKVQGGYLNPPRLEGIFRKSMTVLSKDVFVNQHLWYGDFEGVHEDAEVLPGKMHHRMQLYLVNIMRDFGNFLTTWEVGCKYLSGGIIVKKDWEDAKSHAVRDMLAEMKSQGYVKDWHLNETPNGSSLELQLNYRNKVELQDTYTIKFSQIFLK